MNVNLQGKNPSNGATDLATVPKIQRNCVILLSNINRKHEEWQQSLNSYGLLVEMHPYPKTEEELIRIASRPDVRFVCDEESRLWNREKSELCKWQHLEPVTHISKIRVYSVQRGELVVNQYESSKEGYLDLIRGGKTADGWWDTAFRLSSTHQTYQEQRPKRSARDEALSLFMQEKLHYKRDPSTQLPVKTIPKAVDFSRSVAEQLRAEPFFYSKMAQEMYISGLTEMAISRGLFERIGRNRSQNHFWESNFAGIPSVPKPDLIHRATYKFHDITHMLLGEALLIDENDKLSRQIYYLSRMCSEAFTLFLADGLFVESLRRSGVKYDYSQRKAHPFLVASLNLLDRTPTPQELLECVRANARFFVLGDSQPFEKLKLSGVWYDQAFDGYTNWYKTFSCVDAEWTLHNYTQLAQQRSERRTWWEGVAAIREANPHLNVFTTSEIQSRINWGDHHAKNREELGLLLDQIIEESFKRNVAPLFRDEPLENISIEEHTRRAFVRWMTGQIYLFDVIKGAPGSSVCKQIIIDTLIKSGEEQGDVNALCTNVRELFDSHLGSLQSHDLIDSEQHNLWRDCFPHFPPHYLSYNNPDQQQFDEAIDSLVSENSRRPTATDIAAGTVVLMTDGERFIIQRKDNMHPVERCRGLISLFGGSCDDRAHMHTEENSWVGLMRELHEEIINPSVVNEIYHHTKHAGKFTLPGNQFAGKYQLTLYIAETKPEILTRWFEAMSAPGVVTEGTVELFSKERLLQSLGDTNNFIASLDIPIKRYLNVDSNGVES